MSKTTNTTTNAPEVKAYDILKPMNVALKLMRENNNARPISKDFAMACGVNDRIHSAWVRLLEKELYPIALEWGKKFNNKAATQSELDEAMSAIFPIWRRLCDVGKEGHQNLFIREADAVRIAAFSVKPGYSYMGTVEVAEEPKKFRQAVETMLGIRMAQTAVLTPEQYDTIVKYDKAKINLDKAELRLNGGEQNGQTVEGLRTTLATKKTTLSAMTEFVNNLKVKPEEAEKLLETYKADVESCEAQIAQTEANIAKLKKKIAELEPSYKKVMATINKIK